MDKMADILLFMQVVCEQPLKNVFWLLLLLVVIVAMVLGAFTAFMVIDKIVWEL